MKSSVTLQEKLAKQNEISRQKLAQELVNLEKVEKTELKMLESARQRLRSRHKNLETRQPSTGSNAINVRMYETHNPGFCYHCTGAIKETGTTIKQQVAKDSYEFVHSILFTRGEVDPQKVLCLHLLTAHSTKWNNNDSSTVRPVPCLLERAKNRHYSGVWNNILPCYVVDIEATSIAQNVKLHEDPRALTLENQAIRDFEEKYKQYMDNNADFGKTLSHNDKQTKMTTQGLEKMPPISPHVYSLLGPSHELRIKQALAENVTRKKFMRSSMELNGFDEGSFSFRLDDDDDLLSRATNMSNRNWATRSTHTPSRRSTMGSSFRLDQGITMLKRSKPNDLMLQRSRNSDTPRDLVTIKSSSRAMREAPSKTSSTKSPFRSIFGNGSSMNSILSFSHEAAARTFRKRIYLNSPIGGVELEDKDHAIVPILVNYQVQALVQTVFEVLERVNPEKLRRIIETARDTDEIKKMLLRPEIQQFVRSLLGQSLLSSPESFVVSVAAVVDEMDFKFEGLREKEIVALTLVMPALPCLDALVAEIRNNIFLDTVKMPRQYETENGVGGWNEKSWKRNRKFPAMGKEKCCGAKTLKKVDKSKKRASNERQSSLEKNNWMNKIVDQGKENNTVQASGSSVRKNSKMKADEQRTVSGNLLAKRTSNSKSWRAAQDPSHLDADHVILKRMTNAQRILVGQMCASLKTKRINNQGLINESMPLAALITPALSRDTIKALTRGTVYSKPDAINMQQEEMEVHVAVPDKLSGPLLAKIRQDIAESETKKRLKSFLKNES